MARKKTEVFVFGHLAQADGNRFVPAGILGLTETEGARVADRGLASEFAYGMGYLRRGESFELDPVSLALGERESIRGKVLFPVNGLGEFGGIRDAAPDAWGRRVIEARLKAPANGLLEVEYLLHAGGDRVGALDVREDIKSPDSASASDMHSLEYVLQASEAVENGAPIPTNLERFLGSGPSAGGARPKASVRDGDGALWLAKFPANGDRFDVARAESCTLELARRCGLTVPEVRHQDIGGRPVMLIRRFDRYWSQVGQKPPEDALHDTRPGEGRIEGRLPFVSGLTLTACSELESPDKTYADLGRAIHKYVHLDRVKADGEEMFARMVFNIFVTNDDDHLRNHGFIRDPRRNGWVLSPLYDVVPHPVLASERRLHLGVGEHGKLATLDNALSHYAAFMPARPTAIGIMRRVWGEVREWMTCFEEHGADKKLLDQLSRAFRDISDIASPGLEAEIRRGT
ncbi:type II toxin-antitoxin system HipA family toxin [Burkholderia gladioli]|uniref:type II toxin-antitoxin system HipA family toxin n=1 Tax=Burkholderia gladioli TaxID=28095 RepID=UPI000BBD31C4|nr:type II toxin-antitoxin system HipA family toxin [Burkholderia gladioli]ATF89074.1 phosphatidylinositol kinase [Burkholderia gladioli pv. gladioli]MBJ9712491.1 type II toxin-antitoxin system HipA family toxin [Burkholderia gladioli]MBU9157640.1 type II toxin-antitoxin system HipA family toxin [Burkholderia gladioli]MCH7274004.1 type II toxin-antitoxin system HipA family toxin [Burkholderia gladioli]MDZ4038782.1 type II toxin-antitoxin system HipA family toxin [Burkholderia gladioli pv. alli